MLVKVVHLAFQCRTSGQLVSVHGALQLEHKQNTSEPRGAEAKPEVPLMNTGASKMHVTFLSVSWTENNDWIDNFYLTSH